MKDYFYYCARVDEAIACSVRIRRVVRGCVSQVGDYGVCHYS